MSRSVSDALIQEDRGYLYRSACWNCRRRKGCPYSCDAAFESALSRAASQGEAAAQLLTVKAEQLLREVACARSVSDLLCADEALERTLSGILYAEIALIKSLSV